MKLRKKTFLFLGFIITLIGVWKSVKHIQYKENISVQQVIKNKLLSYYLEYNNINIKNINDLDSNKIKNLELEFFHLNISENNWKNLLNLNHIYYNDSLDDYEKSSYYKKNNIWINGQLIHNKTTYRVKVKNHGKSPSGHFKDLSMSLTIKLAEGQQIKGVKKFSFIIYNRIKAKSEAISIFSEEFKLHKIHSKLVKLKINNTPVNLFFFEKKYKNSTLKSFNPNLIKIAYKDRKSIICLSSNDTNELKYILSLNQDFCEKKKYSKKIRNRIKEINYCVFHNNLDSIHTFFDLEYISSFDLVKNLLGFTSHGFLSFNLQIALDTNTLKFYPILHRDNFIWKYDNYFDIYEQTNNYSILNKNNLFSAKSAIFNLISNNAIIRKRSIDKFRHINTELFSQYDDLINIHLDFQKHSFLKKHLFKSNYDHSRLDRRSLTSLYQGLIKHNYDVLQSYYKKEEPYIKVLESDSGLSVAIYPRNTEPGTLKISSPSLTKGRIEIIKYNGNNIVFRKNSYFTKDINFTLQTLLMYNNKKNEIYSMKNYYIINIFPEKYLKHLPPTKVVWQF